MVATPELDKKEVLALRIALGVRAAAIERKLRRNGTMTGKQRERVEQWVTSTRELGAELGKSFPPAKTLVAAALKRRNSRPPGRILG